MDLYPDVKAVVVAHLYGSPRKRVDESERSVIVMVRLLLRMLRNPWEPPTKDNRQEASGHTTRFLLMEIKLLPEAPEGCFLQMMRKLLIR